MAVATKFKYLGVELHGDKDITAAVAHRHSRMVAAQAAVNRRLKELRMHSLRPNGCDRSVCRRHGRDGFLLRL
jgi:hypothetical protein